MPPDQSESHSAMDPDGYIMYSLSDEWRTEQEALRRGTRFTITKSSMMEFFLLW